MGLDVSHGCWHGPYSAFHRWRVQLAELAKYPPLGLMDGFRDELLAEPEQPLISQEPFLRDPLSILLFHSDCDGGIRWWQCGRLALRLLELYREALTEGGSFLRSGRGAAKDQGRADYDGFSPALKRWIFGLSRAYKAREDVRFG